MDAITVRRLYEQAREQIAIDWVAGRGGGERRLTSDAVDKSAFALIGYFNLVHPNRIQVLGNAEKMKAESWASPFGLDADERVKVDDIMSVKETASHMVDAIEGRARAFVQVQNGCDHRCTFCIIPYGRGPSRSVPMGAVVEQIKRLVGNGYREVVLTGVDITSYGPDLPGQPTLGKLVQAILRHVPDLPRLRISSIDSIEADPAFYDAIASSRVMPHLHLSLQSGDDLILKRMKRRHSRDEALHVVARFRAMRPEMVFGADIIAGFPTETDEMFEQTLNIVDEANLTFLHVFPFSPRPGTPAARMPQVGKATARQRAAQLRAKGDAKVAQFCAVRVGSMETVLIERDGMGRTEQFVPIAVGGFAPGTIVPVLATGVSELGLVGEPMRTAA